MIVLNSRRPSILAAVASIAMVNVASAAQFYYGGYDATNLIQGTPDLPVTGPFIVAGQTTFYSDAAGTTPNAAGTGFVTATNVSAELILGGSAAATAYTASTPSSTATVAIRGITLLANNAGTNTLSLGFTASGRYSFASGGTGTLYGVGITQNGSANWNFVNTGASSAPFRAQNSFNIVGTGSGNISIPFNIANNSGQPSMSVNLTGGSTLTLGARNDYSGSGGTPSFTLTNGAVDFLNSRAFGQFNVQIRLNGGTIYSSAGTSIDNGYVGTGGTAGESPIRIGGNVTFGGGSVAWGTGNAGVTLSGTRTITANNTSATGTTIPGIVSDNGTAAGLNLTSTNKGRITFNGANTYTGLTTLNGGVTVALGAAAQNTILNLGGADVQNGKFLFDYTGGTSPAATIKTILDNSALSGFATGVIRNTTAGVSGLTLGYGDNNTNTVTIMTTLPGDADLNGAVNFNDFLVLQNNFGTAGTRFDQGNFNYDGQTDFNDFLALQNYFGQSITGQPVAFTRAQIAAITAFAATVPEPASLAAIGLGGVAILRRCRAD